MAHNNSWKTGAVLDFVHVGPHKCYNKPTTVNRKQRYSSKLARRIARAQKKNLDMSATPEYSKGYE